MIRLNNAVHDAIRTHAAQTYPEECCGVLLGKEKGDAREVSDIVEVRNSKDDNRERRYIVSPEDYRNAEQHAASVGLTVLGVYHSHPDHPAEPSQFDLDHALPWFSYIIVGVDKGDPHVLRSWCLHDDRTAFDVEELVVPASNIIHNYL